MTRLFEVRQHQDAGTERQGAVDLIAGAGVKRIEAGEDGSAANIGRDDGEIFEALVGEAVPVARILAEVLAEAFDVDADAIDGCFIGSADDGGVVGQRRKKEVGAHQSSVWGMALEPTGRVQSSGSSYW